ncbi:MAG: YeeE/YedE family protein [Aeromonadaceae bacterium]
MTHFTPLTALSGGILIGLAALLFLLIQGRVAGISGILAGLLAPATPDTGWRWRFIGGLGVGGALGFWLLGLPAPELSQVSWPWLLVGGLLVGFGAKLGNGCTSGHGICGIGRLSVRSIVATLLFMLAGMVTVFIMRHVLA